MKQKPALVEIESIAKIGKKTADDLREIADRCEKGEVVTIAAVVSFRGRSMQYIHAGNCYINISGSVARLAHKMQREWDLRSGE